MKSFLRSFTAGAFMLLLGLSTVYAQEATFQSGPGHFPSQGEHPAQTAGSRGEI